MPEDGMRSVARLAMCLILILANAAQTDAQVPSDPHCVNRSADFYPYTGEPCESGYQLGSGNCRNTNGRIVAVPREECLAQGGTVELPFEGEIRPRLAADARPQPNARNVRFGSKRESAVFGLMSASTGCGHSVANA